MAQAKRNLLPIGIHLTPDAVHMAQLEQNADGVKVVSKASCRLSTSAETIARIMVAGDGTGDGTGEASGSDADPVQVGHGRPRHTPRMGGQVRMDEATYGRAQQFIRQTVAADGFRNKEVVINLPQEHLVIQHVRMPPMQPEELKAALPYELQGKLPFDPQSAVVRHIVAGTVSENNETKHDVLVLAVPRHIVEKRVSGMTRMGLTVSGVGVEPCAMCYCYAFAASHSGPSQAGPLCMMVVYLGTQATHVAILRGQETTFVKGIGQGTDHLIETVAKVKGNSLEEAADLVETWRQSAEPATLDEAVETYNRSRRSLGHLTDEIESCIRYHASLARGAGVDQLYFVGPGAADRALVCVLRARLHIPCEVGDPFGTVMGKADPETAEPEMAVAVGLSLFGAQ